MPKRKRTHKWCNKCKDYKPIGEFYEHPEMAGGRLNKCKTCAKKDSRENYRSNLDRCRKYEKTRVRPPGYSTRASRLHRQKNPEKYKARTAVNNALRDGRLKKEPCRCGEVKVQAHHDDYSKPLDVRWVCRRCHWVEEHGGVDAKA